MRVIKDLKKLGKFVMIESSSQADFMKTPRIVREEMKKIKGNTAPLIVVASADLKQIFGAFGYNDILSKNYKKMIREIKSEVKLAQKAGTLNSDLNAGELKGKKGKGGAEATATKSVDDDSQETKTEGGIVQIDSPKMATWTSSKGSDLKAMLLRAEYGELYVFKTLAGKKIEVKANQLSAASLEKAKRLISDQ